MASSTFQQHKGGEHKGNEPFDKAKDAGRDAMNKGKEALDKGGEMMDKVKDAGAQVMNKAKEAAESVGEMAGNAASTAATTATKKADEWTSAAGHKVEEAGEALARKLPQSGIAGQASHAVTEAIKEGGHYLEDAKLSGMVQDVAQVVKNHPIPTMLICFGIGFCLGRALKD